MRPIHNVLKPVGKITAEYVYKGRRRLSIIFFPYKFTIGLQFVSLQVKSYFSFIFIP